MKLLEPLLKAKTPRDLLVIKAHAAGPQRLFVAFEAFVHETKKAATCIVSVDLATLAVELVHERAGSSVDYLHDGGWHGLLQRESIIELAGKTPVVTSTGFSFEGEQLSAIARTDHTTFVCGTKRIGNYAIDGFVARVSSGQLVYILETSKVGEPGPLEVLAVSDTRLCAGGGVVYGGKNHLFVGDVRFFDPPIALGHEAIFSLHVRRDGALMIGANAAAALVQGGKVTALSGPITRVCGVTEFRGEEYWMSHDLGDFMWVCRRSGTKLVKKYKSKFHYVGYRGNDGAPDARMTATDDLLVVTNKDRIHVFDGKTWSQLALQPDSKKLFKRLPAAMKR